MVGKKVYAVELKVIEDRRELRNEVVLFADKEHAKAFAQNFIESEKEILNKKIESGSWIEDDDLETQSVWECYKDGYRSYNISRVSISEKTIQ